VALYACLFDVFSDDVAVANRACDFLQYEQRDLPGIPNGTAVTNRTIGFGAQPLFLPASIRKAFKSKTRAFYPLFLKDLNNPCNKARN